jgi:hypothetical protein
MKKIILFLILIPFISFSKEIYSPPIEYEIKNVKLYSLKALNLSLKALSSLNAPRKNIEEIKVYLKSSLFFLNEATDFSPSYTINKKIDTLIMRIELFNNENIKPDLISLKDDIEDIRGNITNYSRISQILNEIIENYTPENNKKLIDKLNQLKKEIKLPLIDTPIENAKMFIAVAYDNVKSRKYTEAKKSIEIALDPLINITSRENTYLVIFKDYIYESYLNFKDENYDQAGYLLKKSKYFLIKAREVSDDSRQKIIDGILKRIDLIYNNDSSRRDEILKEYLILIQDLKNL